MAPALALYSSQSKPMSFIVKSLESLVVLGPIFCAVLVGNLKPPFVANLEIPLDEIFVWNWTGRVSPSVGTPLFGKLNDVS